MTILIRALETYSGAISFLCKIPTVPSIAKSVIAIDRKLTALPSDVCMKFLHHFVFYYLLFG